MDKKYELFKPKKGNYLYRIRALKDFSGVKRGDVGGYIQSEYNLAQDGDCWVYDDSIVIGRAQVLENSKIYGKSKLRDYVNVKGNSAICGTVVLEDSVVVNHSAFLMGKIFLRDHVIIKDTAIITGSIVASGYSIISGTARLLGNFYVPVHSTLKCGLITISPFICTFDKFYVTVYDKYATLFEETYTIEEWFTELGKNVFKQFSIPLSKYHHFLNLLLMGYEDYNMRLRENQKEDA